MSLPLPTSLSPSKVSSFKDSALAFRFSAIDRRPEPPQVRVIGTELLLEAPLPGGSLTLRGIIDRLELDDDGELVVTDYKTGKAPWAAQEQSRLGGVHFYAFLCEQLLGRRPARVQLLHLREPIAISTVPSAQSVRG